MPAISAPKYIKPKLRAKRARKQQQLLRAFEELGRLSHTLRRLRMTTGNHYWWLRTDPDYKKRFIELQRDLKSRGLFPSSYKKPRASLFNRRRRRPKQRAFLKAYSRLVHVGLACKAAQIADSTHHAWLRNDPWYRRTFDQIKHRVLLKPPQTRVRKKKNLKRPVGVGSVMPRSYGFMVEWYGTDSDGQRRARRRQLRNVSEADAWRYLLDKIKADPPKHGPIAYGYVPSVDSLMRPNYKQVSKTALTATKPSGLRNRASGTGQIRLNKNSIAITWYDTAGRRHYENLGPVTLEQALAVLEKRTARDRRRRQEAQELAKKFLLQHPPLTDDMRQQDAINAAALRPRSWCVTRDVMGYPLTSVVEPYRSWARAYDSKDVGIRKYLTTKKAQAASRTANPQTPDRAVLQTTGSM
jgi:hypothetical protein